MQQQTVIIGPYDLGPQGEFSELWRPVPCPKAQIERRPPMTLLALIALTLTAPDDKEALEKAVAKVAAYESYAFKGETEFQSQFGGNGAAPIPSMDGKYQKDVGMHIKTERGEFFRKGERVLVKQGESDWADVSQLKPPTPSADAPPKKRAPRGGFGLAQVMLRNFKAPHDELKELAKNFKEVKKQEKTE